jgi:hypothetical protein
MRTDGQTDMTKLIVIFRHFAKAPKVGSSVLALHHIYEYLLGINKDNFYFRFYGKNIQRRMWKKFCMTIVKLHDNY